MSEVRPKQTERAAEDYAQGVGRNYLTWASNPLSATAPPAAAVAGGQDVAWNWPGGDTEGNAIGWSVATELWEHIGIGDSTGLRGRAMPAACFTLMARHNLRSGGELRPEDLHRFVLTADEPFWRGLLEGETDSAMLYMFGDSGSFYCLSPKARANLLGPFLRCLQPLEACVTG
jgi:hypothetical protein